MRIYRPHGWAGAPRPGVVFYHGGGFVLCDIDSHDAFCRAMSRHTDSVVVSVGYRLAPEHPRARRREDAYGAFDWVARHAAELGVDAQRIAVAGDSAGGNLAAVTSILCRERGTSLPMVQVLLYPVIDPSFDTASYRRRAHRILRPLSLPCNGIGASTSVARPLPEPAYLVAPARAESLAGLPPAVVVTATLDPLHERGCGLCATAYASTVSPVVHRDFRGLFHGFLTMPALPSLRSAPAICCGPTCATLLAVS